MAKASQSEDNSTLRKGSWSLEEDQKLIAYISRYGIWNWQEMAKSAGLQRSGKSCRLRWVNYLKPGIKHGNFTREEEETVIELRGMLGNRWSVIASKLPGRTDNEIKNYWHSHLSKRLKYSSMPTSTVSQIPNVETEPKSSYNTHFSPPKATNASTQEDSGSTKQPFPQYSSHGLSSLSTVMSAADINKNQTNQDTLGPSRSVGELQKHVKSG